MKVILNNENFEIASGATLATLAEKLQLPETGVAVAIDYEVVSRCDWERTELSDGVEITLTQAVSGG